VYDDHAATIASFEAGHASVAISSIYRHKARLRVKQITGDGL